MVQAPQLSASVATAGFRDESLTAHAPEWCICRDRTRRLHHRSLAWEVGEEAELPSACRRIASYFVQIVGEEGEELLGAETLAGDPQTAALNGLRKGPG